MLRFIGSDCGSERIQRREFLRLGSLAGLGLAAHVRQGNEAFASGTHNKYPGFGKAKSVILLYASGGQSQIDMWDPKPRAPVEIRGEFKTIATSVPGTFLGEHLPRLAQLAHLYSLVRSVSHDDLDHGSATYLALTGRFHPRKSSNPLPQPTDAPSYGAILTRVQPSTRFPHTAIDVNGPALVPEVIAPGQFAGFLGRGCEPLHLGDVSQPLAPLVGLEPVAELPTVRMRSRRNLLQSVEHYCRALEQDHAMLEMNVLYQQAYRLLSSPQCRKAFDLTQEPVPLREQYGRYRAGQACLLARRLVEAGVPLITVMCHHSNRGQDKDPGDTDSYGWDTHNDIFEALKMHLLPRFDQTLATLLTDLDRRGLLDQTLVVCMGEFGRAPQVALEKRFAGSSPGRKHWASVYSILMAGAGVSRGKVFGSSDRMGGYPSSNPVGPWDVAATMFSALGVDPDAQFTDPGGRPFPVSTGTPMAGLYEG